MSQYSEALPMIEELHRLVQDLHFEADELHGNEGRDSDGPILLWYQHLDELLEKAETLHKRYGIRE